MTEPFWSNDPTILFNKNSIYQVWPTQSMTIEAKLNSVSRIVIILTILGFMFTRNWNFIVVGIITLAILLTIYNLRKKAIIKSLTQKEGFDNSSKLQKTNDYNSKTIVNPETLETLLRSDFHPTTKQNPLGNVLLTDINDHPNRKAAAPSFNPDVYEDINNSVKKQTQMLNPGIINTNKKLYGDLKDNYDLDTSMMRFYSTANTRVTNDQGAYASWLYGNMPSGKSSGPDGAFARVQNSWQWINP